MAVFPGIYVAPGAPATAALPPSVTVWRADMIIGSGKWVTRYPLDVQDGSSTATSSEDDVCADVEVDCSEQRKVTVAMSSREGILIVDLGIVAPTTVAEVWGWRCRAHPRRRYGRDVVPFCGVVKDPVFPFVRLGRSRSRTFCALQGVPSLFALLTRLHLREFFVLETDADFSTASICDCLGSTDRFSPFRARLAERTGSTAGRTGSTAGLTHFSVFIYDQTTWDERSIAEGVFSCRFDDVVFGVVRHCESSPGSCLCEYVEVRVDLPVDTEDVGTSRGVLLSHYPNSISDRDGACHYLCEFLSHLLFSFRMPSERLRCSCNRALGLSGVLRTVLSACSFVCNGDSQAATRGEGEGAPPFGQRPRMPGRRLVIRDSPSVSQYVHSEGLSSGSRPRSRSGSRCPPREGIIRRRAPLRSRSFSRTGVRWWRSFLQSAGPGCGLAATLAAEAFMSKCYVDDVLMSVFRTFRL